MTHKHTSQEIFSRAKELRRNPTEAEARLWARLRSHRLAGFGFRRQHAIGPYIVDFCAPRAKLIVEVDGSQHLDQEHYDAVRTQFLQDKGYRVLRFWNHEVLADIDTVMAVIFVALQGT